MNTMIVIILLIVILFGIYGMKSCLKKLYRQYSNPGKSQGKYEEINKSYDAETRKNKLCGKRGV